MTHLLLFLLAAVLFSTAQLCLGLWIGAKYGRNCEQRRFVNRAVELGRPETDIDGSIPWPEGTVLLDSLAQQVQSLVLASVRGQPAVSDRMSAALSELQKSVVALQQRICTVPTNLPDRPPAETSPAGHAPLRDSPAEPSDAVAGRQSTDMVNQIRNAAGPDVENEPHLFTYDAVGYMAPCDEHEVPHTDTFRPVVCHAISVHTISFYADCPPDYEFLTISVGPAPQVIFILCRVLSWREVYLEQQHRYLVACEFTRRLEPDEIQWQDVYGESVGAQKDCHSSKESPASH